MTLKHKSTAVLILLLTIMAAVQYSLTWLQVMPKFVKIENNDLQGNIHRVQQSLKQELKHLDNLCYDWATWDDTYQYIVNNSQSYIESNLSSETLLEDLNVQHIQFIDITGKTKWVRSQLEEGDEITLDNIPHGIVSLQHSALPAIDSLNIEHAAVNGLLLEHGRLMLVSTRQILKSNGEGPSRGFVIFGRFLLEDELKNLTQVELTFTQAENTNWQQKATGEPGKDRLVLNTPNESIRVAELYLRDIFGNYPLMVKMVYDRLITLEGRQTINVTALLIMVSGLVFIMLIVVLINRHILSPLELIKQHILRIEKDQDYTKMIDCQRTDELGQISQSINKMLNTIHQKNHELETVNKELNILSMHDPLTGIANRRFFDKALLHEWNSCRRLKINLSVIMCDIDFFKKYNDTYGHQMGDDCIVSIANIIKHTLHRANDIVARYGGEEFIILMPDTDTEGAKILTNKLIQNLAEANIEHIESTEFKRITMSFGIASIVPDSQKDFKELVKQADEALYVSKKNGRNQLSAYYEDGIRSGV